MVYQPLTESTSPDYMSSSLSLAVGIYSVPVALEPGSTSSESCFAELIDPSLLSLHVSPHPTAQTTVNPADLALHPVGVISSYDCRYGPVAYDTGNELSTKRRTASRRMLRGCSTRSRLNVLPSTPNRIVDRFWAVYSLVHDLSTASPSDPRLFRGFFECDGQLNQCLLCDYKIQNQTQMVQHLMGLHFDLFQHQCSWKGCSYSSTRPADLKTHVREQHDNSGVGHQCAICGKKIKHKRNYVRHVKGHKQADETDRQDTDRSRVIASDI